jgi:hypothetical protein
VKHLINYEKAIRGRVKGAEEGGLFKVYGGVEDWARKEQFRFVIAFNVAFLLPVLLVPALVLWGAPNGGRTYSLVYAGLCLLVFFSRIFVGGLLRRGARDIKTAAGASGGRTASSPS